MSGIDEQFSNRCPECKEIPPIWSMTNGSKGPFIWLCTEEYFEPEMRNTIKIATYKHVKNVDEAAPFVEYLMCYHCVARIEDESFIRNMIAKAKQLERRGRVYLS